MMVLRRGWDKVQNNHCLTILSATILCHPVCWRCHRDGHRLRTQCSGSWKAHAMNHSSCVPGLGLEEHKIWCFCSHIFCGHLDGNHFILPTSSSMTFFGLESQFITYNFSFELTSCGKDNLFQVTSIFPSTLTTERVWDHLKNNRCVECISSPWKHVNQWWGESRRHDSNLVYQLYKKIAIILYVTQQTPTRILKVKTQGYPWLPRKPSFLLHELLHIKGNQRNEVHALW